MPWPFQGSPRNYRPASHCQGKTQRPEPARQVPVQSGCPDRKTCWKEQVLAILHESAVEDSGLLAFSSARQRQSTAFGFDQLIVLDVRQIIFKPCFDLWNSSSFVLDIIQDADCRPRSTIFAGGNHVFLVNNLFLCLATRDREKSTAIALSIRRDRLL